MSSAILLSGCTPVNEKIEQLDGYAQERLSSIPVPFEWFKLDKKKADTNESWHNIAPLNLSDKDQSKERFKSEEVMIADLTKEVVNREAMKRFAEDTSSSYEAFPHFSTSEGKDTFGDTVRSIYRQPHEFVTGLTLTGMGERETSKGKESILTVSMNSINDTEKFIIHDFIFTLNDKKEITNVVLNQKSSRINTHKPLSQDSEWNETVHKEFKFVWNDFKAFPENENWKQVDANVFTSWVSTMGVEEDKDSAVVMHNWYQKNEGKLSRAKITGYLHTDHSALAQTLYEVSYPIKNQKQNESFTVIYDRGVNQIVGLRKGSPFQYKGE